MIVIIQGVAQHIRVARHGVLSVNAPCGVELATLGYCFKATLPTCCLGDLCGHCPSCDPAEMLHVFEMADAIN